jgi:serine/threonine protein kinase/Tfp pilus assembly protein PilF
VAVKCPKCHSENSDTSLFCSACGTKLESAAEFSLFQTETLEISLKELSTGSTFAGRYQVIEELGKGGMGKVYKVFDTKIKEKIALKLIKSEIASDRETIERFSNELKLARKIRHKNVCGMFDISEAEGAHFITMEYVGGEDLKTMIRMSGMLGIGTVLSVGKQICDGLTEAHSQGVVHRDLKPTNIMIDKGGNVKIMDFGIARSLREKGITSPSVLIGTPEYMSPEQAEAKEVDYRSDIYSLGIILYEMAAGRVPFEGDTALSIAIKHKGEIPKNPKQFNPNIPDDLSGVVLKCLEKDKSKRYQTAGEVRSELEKIEKGIPTTERIVPERKPVTSREITVKFSPKRLFIPVLIVIIFIIGIAVVWQLVLQKDTKSITSSKRSIAVLPFVDYSPEKGHEYLCEGIPDTLINALNYIQNLRVPARTSAFSFQGKEYDIREIGQKLNVDNVLEGSIQVVGNNLRVTARLSEVKNGYQLWNASYDRKLEDVFAIQDEIAQAIVRALKLRLLGEKEAPFIRRYTENLEAYSLYLKGLYHWNRRTGKDLSKAIEFYESAIREDPNYALAYIGLADSYSLLTLYSDARPQESFPKAKAAAIKALDLDENLAEAHNSLAYVYERYDWNWEASEAEFRRTLELNPNYATGHFWYSELLMTFGRFEESILEMKRALELDPVSLIINASLGYAYLQAGRPDQALPQLRKSLEMDPNFAYAHQILGMTYADLKRFDEAIDELKKARELSGDAVMMVASLGLAYGEAGKLEEAKNILEELEAKSQRQYVSPYWTAALYSVLGDVDKAFELMNKAVEERSEWILAIKSGLAFIPFHSDPRYQALLKKIGLD